MMIRKFYFAWHEKKEKAFLEENSREGYRLVKIGLFKYYFEPCPKEDRLYEADFRFLDKMSEDEYIQLYADAGWSMDAKYGGWYFFSKLKTEDNNSLFSDYHSLKDKYKRILLLLLLTGFPLYYQLIIFIPLMGELEVPSFYYGMRLILYILTPLHFFALVKMFTVYKSIINRLKE